MEGWYCQHQHQYRREEGMPVQLGCILGIVFVLLSSSYVHYEAAVDAAVDQVKLVLALSPLLLLLAARFLSAVDTRASPAANRDVPWGIVIILVLVLLLISRRS